jgi:guanylate kinase
MNMHNNPSEPSRRGLWIAFFGPDGAGKSAVIEELSGKLETSFVGITRFHFRPRFRRQGVDWPPVPNRREVFWHR